MNTSGKYSSVDAYHADFPQSIRLILEKIRIALKQAAPNAEEVISYNMPAIKQNGVLVYYAAYKNHIGFYPILNPVKVFKEDLVKYKT